MGINIKLLFDRRKSQAEKINCLKKGQIVVEYILLLFIVLAAAGAILTLVGTDDPGGALVEYWRKTIIAIGKDIPLDH